ncbi:CFI-box-CTERM domain-containing protein [Laspinema olomoucense]|uniref:CFI-box-CTERM domain-containing protein n=1 Tax=Laspinema olomoucense TaxID=3231600 RepID=UPI0021BAC019|nr:CFI-box-CTERM domain-containing protein [Laspinema sp. D3d]MCT7974034.1 hypothetical protein [Laspinema sp. D3d]
MNAAIEQLFDKHEKHIEKARYYEEQNQYTQAIKEYASALSSFALALDFSYRDEKYPPLDQKLSVMLSLAVALSKVAIWYHKAKEPRKALVLANDAQELLDVLRTYESNFDVREMKLFESLSNHSSLITDILTLNAGEIQSDDMIDENFNKIKTSSEKICNLSVSLLPRRETSSSYTTNDSCFIATAAYSTAKHPDIDTFRQFRDENLLTHFVGKQFVIFYYRIGPILAHYVKNQPAIKGFLRHHLARLAEWMRSQKMRTRSGK